LQAFYVCNAFISKIGDRRQIHQFLLHLAAVYANHSHFFSLFLEAVGCEKTAGASPMITSCQASTFSAKADNCALASKILAICFLRAS
jgi:hypothetical protein